MEGYQLVETLRIKANMTQEDVGRYVGVTRMAVGKWESGKTRITKPKAKALAELFNISIEEIINGNDTPYSNPRLTDSGHSVARYRATNKYCENHYDYYKLRFYKGERDEMAKIAKEHGYDSFHQFIMDAIEEKRDRLCQNG